MFKAPMPDSDAIRRAQEQEEREHREREERDAQAAAKLRAELVVLEAIQRHGAYWPGD